MRLTEDQKKGLAQLGYRWVRTIRRLDLPGQELEEGILGGEFESWWEVLDLTHLLPLALKHLDQCLVHLNAAGYRVRGDRAFKRIWASEEMRDLRNALEHEEEYVAGGRLNPDLVGPNWEPGYGDRRFDWNEEGIHELTVLGRTYKIRPALAAARKLEYPLLQMWDPVPDS